MPKGQKGGAAPGERRGGRQKGTKDKVSRREKMRAECAATGLTPLEYMLGKLRDPVAPLEVRQWAAIAAAPFVHPKLTATTLADGKDLPTNLAMTDRELARRVALILTRAGAESAVVGRSGISVTRSAGSEGTTRGLVSSPGTSSPSPTRHGNAGNGAVKGGGGPRANSGSCIPTQEPQPEIPSEISAISKPPRPKVGEEAVIGAPYFDEGGHTWHAVTVRNLGPVRDGPDRFGVLDRDVIVKDLGGDYDAALAWARKKYHLIDPVITIAAIKPGGADLNRPDQRETGPGRPTVRHSYPERKAR